MNLPEWGPMSQIICGSQEIAPDLHKIEDSQYFLTTPYNSPSLEPALGAPFVSALLWACSDGAALRAVSKEKEKDDNLVCPPPSELVPSTDSITYGQILSRLKFQGVRGILEWAAYRMTDGDFIHRVIASEIADYYFRGLDDDDDEIPYAILWKLKRR